MNTKSRIEKILKDSNTGEARSHAILRTLMVTLAKWEGKRINKRACDAMRVALPAGAHVSYNPSKWADSTIHIWGIPGHEDYNNRTSFYTPDLYTADKFLDRNRWAGEAAVERMRRREVHLRAYGAIEKAATAIDEFNAAKLKLDAALELLEDDKSQIRKELCLS